MPRRLLAVFAHPDDEAYGVSGLLARLGAAADAGAALLCLTRGEASSVYAARGLSRDEVGALRTGRLERVAEDLLLVFLDAGTLHLPFLLRLQGGATEFVPGCLPGLKRAIRLV